MRLMKKGITLKILILIAMVTLLQASMLILVSHNLSKSSMSAVIDDNAVKSTEVYSALIGNWLEERIKEIETYAECPEVKTMDWDMIEPYLLEEMSRKNSIYDVFLVAEPNGEYNTTLKRNPSNASDRDYFKRAMNGYKVVSDPLYARSSGNEVSVVAVPIKDHNGNIIGVMGGSINLKKLSDFIESYGVTHPDSYSFIIDSDGLIIAHPNKDIIMKESILRASNYISEEVAKASSKYMEDEKGSIVLKLDGIPSISYYSTIPNTDGWRLITKIPLEYSNAPIKSVSIKLAVIGTLIIAIGILLGCVIAKGISNPIIRLRDVFTKAAGGDLTVRAAILEEDEIGEACRSFNKMMDTISDLTYNDPLTGLPNKSIFNNRLEQEIARASKERKKLAMLLIDIDKFESINTAMGHCVGDKLLKLVSDEISKMIDKNDIVSRMGEDKFGVLYTDVVIEGNTIKNVLDIMEMIKQPWVIDNHKFYITASSGIVFYPNDGEDADTLMKNSYSAMSKAKRAGRDSYQLYDPSVGNNIADMLALDNSIHNALDNGEFEIFYQPQLDISTSRIVGAEALLRWKHPELGMVSPAKFIPLIEENGLIISIGEWVLRNACQQNKSWQNDGFDPLYVSVNISPRQLMQDRFTDMVQDALLSCQLEPKYLELEITESAAMEDTDKVIGILKKLRRMGVKIAIDDFGTGYSSLNYLKNFEITTLKIDKSFINDITSDTKDAAIVSTILAIGHNLELTVTAEGVETVEQLNYLKEKNCQLMQGYLYSKPIPAPSFEGLLRNPHTLGR